MKIKEAVRLVEDGETVDYETAGAARVYVRLSEEEENTVDVAIHASGDVEDGYYFDAADLRKTAKLFLRLADMLDNNE